MIFRYDLGQDAGFFPLIKFESQMSLNVTSVFAYHLYPIVSSDSFIFILTWIDKQVKELWFFFVLPSS
jgi:hypothetical protein